MIALIKKELERVFGKVSFDGSEPEAVYNQNETHFTVSSGVTNAGFFHVSGMLYTAMPSNYGDIRLFKTLQAKEFVGVMKPTRVEKGHEIVEYSAYLPIIEEVAGSKIQIETIEVNDFVVQKNN